MRRNAQYAILLIIVLIALFVTFGMLWLSALSTRTTSPEETSTTPPLSTEGALAVAHHFEGGVHTYTGTLDLPTPCHTVKADVTAKESMPEQIAVNLITTTPAPGTVCAQTVTAAPFTASFQASETAQVQFSINGNAISVTVTEQ